MHLSHICIYGRIEKNQRSEMIAVQIDLLLKQELISVKMIFVQNDQRRFVLE